MAKTEASEKLRKALRGPVVAMTTPFKDDLSLDLDGLRKLTDLYIEGGIKNVIVTGSTGEFFSMTDEERKKVIKTVVDHTNGKMTVIAGCPHSGTQLALELVKFSEDIGADGVMVTPPYYSFSGFEGIKRHYEIISDESNIGIVVYFSGSVLRFPEVNGMIRENWACPEGIKELAAIPNVGAIKDASGNFGFHRDITMGLDGENAQVTVMGSNGMGYHLWGHMYGSKCFLTGLGNIWPKIEVEFFNRLENGDQDGALQIVKEKEIDYLRVAKATGKYWCCVKYLLDLEGLPGGPARPPLLDLTAEDKKAVKAMAERIGLLSK